MKGPKELKNYVSKMRRWFKDSGRKNGHIPSFAWDDLTIFKLERCKKWKSHRKRKHKSNFE